MLEASPHNNEKHEEYSLTYQGITVRQVIVHMKNDTLKSIDFYDNASEMIISGNDPRARAAMIQFVNAKNATR